MERRAAQPRLRLIWGLLVLTAGCDPGSTSISSPVPHPTSFAHDLRVAPVTAALTAAEVNAFLSIVWELPGTPAQAVPPPACDFPTDPSQLREGMERLRSDYRSRLEPAYQAQLWCADPAMRSAFQDQQIDPEAFASLTVRVSSAWSALSWGSKVSVSQTWLRLEQQIEQLVAELKGPAQESTTWGREQKLQALEEAIALSEFLRLIDKVPDESLKTVEQFAPQLQSALPRSPASAAFERRIESPPRVLQTGFERR